VGKYAEAFAPWEYVKEELEARGWSVRDFAERMDGDPDVNELAVELLRVEGLDCFMGETLARGLGHAFGTSWELWLNLERKWREWKGWPLEIKP